MRGPQRAIQVPLILVLLAAIVPAAVVGGLAVGKC